MKCQVIKVDKNGKKIKFEPLTNCIQKVTWRPILPDGVPNITSGYTLAVSRHGP